MTHPDENEDEDSYEELAQHLPSSKKLDYNPVERRRERLRNERQSETPVQRAMRANPRAAVLGSNHPDRLRELVDLEAVTHRGGDGGDWRAASIAFKARGYVPIYYRCEGLITHTGIITDIELYPHKGDKDISRFIEHIAPEDDYGKYNDNLLGEAAYIVRDGYELPEPFTQDNLEKASGEGPVKRNYPYQPANVLYHSEHFPTLDNYR